MDKKIYKTKNLFVASYINATGKARFFGIQPLNSKVKLFLFTPFDAASELEAEYFAGGKIQAKTLFAEYNSLKDLLFQRETNGERSYEET